MSITVVVQDPNIVQVNLMQFSGQTAFLDNAFAIENAVDPTKELSFSLGSMTTGKELTIAVNQSVNATLNIPNIGATDTLATLGLAQTWSAVQTFTSIPVFSAGLGTVTGSFNGSLGATTPNTAVVTGLTFNDPTTQTKQIKLQASGATASTILTLADIQTTSQTLSFPNITGADTLASLGLAQTFSAVKTFSAVPVFSAGIGTVTGAFNGSLGATTPSTIAGTTFTASGLSTITNTTGATNSLTGAFVVGNGTGSTSIALGGGGIIAGGAITATGSMVAGTTFSTLNGTVKAVVSGGSPGTFIADNGTSSTQSGIQFNDNGTQKWNIYKTSAATPLLNIYDGVNAQILLTFNPGLISAGFINSPLTLDATNSTTAAFVLSGGLAVAKSAIFGTNVTVGNLAAGSVVYAGTGGLLTTNSALTFQPTIAAAGAGLFVNAVNATLTSGQGNAGRFQLAYNPGSASTGTYVGIYGLVQSTIATQGGGLIGVLGGTILNTGASGTYANAYGVQGLIANSVAGATLTSGYAFYVANPTTTGTITTFVGLRIDALSGSGTSYAIQTGGAGLVSIGDTTSASSATVGAFVVGNGTTGTSVAIGAGKITLGSVLTAPFVVLNTTGQSAYGGTVTQNMFLGSSGTFAANSWAFQSGGGTTAGGGFYFGLNNGTSTSTVGYIGTSPPTGFGGTLIAGRNNAAADVAGVFGESITSAVTAAAAGATTVTANITSISLTAGKWRISGLGIWTGGATGLTSGSTVSMSITSTTAGTGTMGATATQESVLALLANGLFQLVIPEVIVNISATTTYYLTGVCSYIAGSPTIAGNITAVRL
jgi:hypothetical protein